MPVWERTEQYIKAQPQKVQEVLRAMQQILREALPGA